MKEPQLQYAMNSEEESSGASALSCRDYGLASI